MYVPYHMEFPGSALVCPANTFSWIKWEDKSLVAFLQRPEEPKRTSGIAENLFIYLNSWIYSLRIHCIKHESRKRQWFLTDITCCSSSSQEWSCNSVRGRGKKGLDTSKVLPTCTYPSEPLGHARCAFAIEHCWAAGKWGWGTWTDNVLQ